MASVVRKFNPLVATIATFIAQLKAELPGPQRGECHLVRVPAGAAALKSGVAKADSQPATPSAQPAYPSAVSVTTSGWTSTATVAVTITGRVRGVDGVTETLTVPTGGTTQVGSVPFETISGITWQTPAGWSSGTFSVVTNTKLGLPLPPTFSLLTVSKVSVWDETATPPVPANDSAPTVDATNGTLIPGTAADAAHSYRVVFSYVPGTRALVHLDADERTVSTADAASLDTSIELARALVERYAAHRADTLHHKAADSTNTVATAKASIVDLTTVIAAANQLKAALNAHASQSGVHVVNDASLSIATTDASDQGTANTLLNAIKTAMNAHFARAYATTSWRAIEF